MRVTTTVPTSALRAPAVSRGFSLVLGCSLALHVAVLAGFAWWEARKLAVIELPDQPIEVKMVRLGKPRDQKLLPRVDQAPRPKPAPAEDKAVPVPTLDKKAPPPAEAITKADDKPKEKDKPKPAEDDFQDRMKSAMNRLRAADDRDSRMKEAMGRFAAREGPADPKDEPEGQPDGDRMGDSPTPSQVNGYLAAIGARVKQHYIVPSVIQAAQCARLVATVIVRIDSTGAVLETSVQGSSGNDIFDSAVIKAVKDASPLPPPPANMRQLVHNGFGFKFRCDR